MYQYHEDITASSSSSMLTLNNRLPLGFTFSYPVEQEYVDRGTLVTWTKGFDIAGVEGQDVVLQLDEAISKRVSQPSMCTVEFGGRKLINTFPPMLEITCENDRSRKRYSGRNDCFRL